MTRTTDDLELILEEKENRIRQRDELIARLMREREYVVKQNKKLSEMIICMTVPDFVPKDEQARNTLEYIQAFQSWFNSYNVSETGPEEKIALFYEMEKKLKGDGATESYLKRN